MTERTGQGRWLTTIELETLGVPLHVSRRWAPRLALRGLAVKKDGRRGLWLVNPDAIPFLLSRKAKVGRPKARRIAKTPVER